MGSLAPNVETALGNLQQATQDVLALLQQKPLDPRDRAKLLGASRDFSMMLEGDMTALRTVFFGVSTHVRN